MLLGIRTYLKLADRVVPYSNLVGYTRSKILEGIACLQDAA